MSNEFNSSTRGKMDAPVFETMPILDNTHTDPETGMATPDDESVISAKRWVDSNQL